MAIEFYNVKKKKKVSINEDDVKKKTYERNGTIRYAFRAVDDDGTNLTKFCSKADFDKIKAPVEA
ncbi:hypothetical protein DID78_06465 [Candidatus Marinamargulisbacteria bacterium SCGC AG-343-D04]|nr:hypothetical protein DID78_06465 [Candidatus Marinamargulisbacteria bacterium SCGC AG-343-D04]